MLTRRFLRTLFRNPRILLILGLLIPLYSFPNLLPSVRASPAPTPKFTFAVAGDWGTVNSSIGLAVLQKIASSSYNPNFTIALGDLGYSDQNPSDWCGNFTKIYRRMVLITGNHDTLNSTFPITYADGTHAIPKDALTSEIADNRSGFLDSITGMKGYINACPAPSASGINWVGSNVTSNGLHCLTTLSTPSCYGREYYFDYPTSNPVMRFIMISAGVCGPWFNGCAGSGYTGWKAPITPATCTIPPGGSEHYCWLKNRIDEAKSEGLWTAVVLHKQCLTDDGNGCESTLAPFNLALNETVGQSIGVDLWLDGHDHSYQRSIKISGPCQVINMTFTPCQKKDTGDGKTSPYLRGNGTVVNIVGTGGMSEGSICPFSASHPCPNQQYFVKLCGSEGPISGVLQTSGCPSGGDHGFLFFNVTTTQINATYVSVTNGSGFTDNYVIRVGNPPGDFSVSPNPASLSVADANGGVSNSVIINLDSFGGFGGVSGTAASLVWTISGPSGTCPGSKCPSLSPSSGASVQVYGGNQSTTILTISANSSTTCGTFFAPVPYTINVAASGGTRSHQVTFSVNVYLKGDVNGDHNVNIVDLVSVAGIFGLKSTDPGFNSHADLNSDQLIGIVDLALVGSDFGASCSS